MCPAVSPGGPPGFAATTFRRKLQDLGTALCFGHIEQAYGFSPVWVRSCGATALLLANRRGHIEQAYGFSPVWVRSWRGTAFLLVNRRGHIEQAYGFSPVWARSCWRTSPFWPNRRGHIEQAFLDVHIFT